MTRWKDAAMVCRWATLHSSIPRQSFREIMGYRVDLWMLDTILNPAKATAAKAA